MPDYPKDMIADLIEGKLPWQITKRIMSDFKDANRFETYIAILQDKVSWDEQILLPIGEHLYIVKKHDERIVKCDCGYEFGDYRRNWKMSALVFVRDTQELLEEVYPGPTRPDPKLQELREFICPGCTSLLETEAVAPGYPVTFDFLPDLEGFYTDILGKPLP
jgi:acetone carboxylase gamma subunit